MRPEMKQQVVGNAQMDPTIDNAVNRAAGKTQAAVPRAPGRFRPFSALARRVTKNGGGAAGGRRDNPELTAAAAQPTPPNEAAQRAQEAAGLGTEHAAGRSGGRHGSNPGTAQHLQTQTSPSALRDRAAVANQRANRAAGTGVGGLVSGAEEEE